MVTAEYDAAISLCRQALPMTERPGLEALRARALNVIGVSRVAIGDEAGIADLEASIAIAREAAASSARNSFAARSSAWSRSAGGRGSCSTAGSRSSPT